MFKHKSFPVSTFAKDGDLEETMSKIATFLDKEKQKAKDNGDKITDIFTVPVSSSVTTTVTVFYDVTLSATNKAPREYGVEL